MPAAMIPGINTLLWSCAVLFQPVHGLLLAWSFMHDVEPISTATAASPHTTISTTKAGFTQGPSQDEATLGPLPTHCATAPGFPPTSPAQYLRAKGTVAS